jgi:hypothetical protein
MLLTNVAEKSHVYKMSTFSNMEHHNNVRDFLSAHLPKIWPDIEKMRKIDPSPLI